MDLKELLNSSRCPICKDDWMIGDVMDRLFDSGQYGTLQDAYADAKSYGWTPDNKKKLSKLVSLDYGCGIRLYQCPSCETMWDNKGREQSEHEKSYILAKISSEYV